MIPCHDDPDCLEQALEYVGDQRKTRTAGRRMKISLGVVGKAYRDALSNPGRHESFADARMSPDYEAFLNQMVREYGYTKEGARALDHQTQSWFAFAIVAAGTIEGVLYCDSTKPDFFSDSRIQDIEHAIAGIAYFVHLRYS
jgi:hypothetical protein